MSPESATVPTEQPPPIVAHTYLKPESDSVEAPSASSGRVLTSRHPRVNIPL